MLLFGTARLFIFLDFLMIFVIVRPNVEVFWQKLGLFSGSFCSFGSMVTKRKKSFLHTQRLNKVFSVFWAKFHPARLFMTARLFRPARLFGILTRVYHNNSTKIIKPYFRNKFELKHVSIWNVWSIIRRKNWVNKVIYWSSHFKQLWRQIIWLFMKFRVLHNA